MPDLSIVIVSWNVRGLLRECLTSIAESLDVEGAPDTEIVVVDSASTDNTTAMIRSEFPSVKLIEMGENVGFSRGNNIGIETSTGSHVFVLNPDTKVIGAALREMVVYLDTHPEIGVLGPLVLNGDGSVQSSRRRFPTLWTGIFESTWLEAIAPKRILDHYYMQDRRDDEISSVDWLMGSAILVRRTVIDQVGGLDPGFFMYSEELDWQKRIKQAGWEVVYFPRAQVVHYGGKSSDQMVAQRHIHFQTSKVRYFRKHHGPLAAMFIRGVLLANYGWQIGLEATKLVLGHKRALRRERVQAYWQVLRTGLKGS